MAKKKRKKETPGHRFGLLIIPDDVIVKDSASVVTEASQCDECRLPGTETEGEEDDC
jgi:hypothetical protein